MYQSMAAGTRLRLWMAVLSFSAVFIVTGCFDVKINGQTYPKETEYFTVTDKNIEDYSVFNKFTDLKTLDLLSVDISASEYDSIASKVNDGTFILWNVPFGNTKVSNISHTLDISPELQLTDTTVFRYFTELSRVNISSIPASRQLMDICNAAREANPDVIISCNTSVYGVDAGSEISFLDLNDIEIEDLSELDYALTALPNIKTVEICSCKLENETIAAFRDRYPDRKIVWAIRIPHFVVRTDAQVFSILGKMKYHDLTSEAFSPIFRYYTELRALDLGHCAVSDLSEITNLKHLHTLILADNSVSDASPLTELKNLNYIEIQYNKIKDATPFGQLAELEDFYIVHNSGLKNILEIANCKKLNRADFSACGIGVYEYGQLRKMVPEGCYLKREDVGDNLRQWRAYNEKNACIRKAFGNWKNVKEFPDWNTTVLWDRDVYAFTKK